MTLRLKKLFSVFFSYKIDAYLVTKDINIAYLTEFPASESWLLVSRRKTFYITDSRYVLEAKQGLKGVAQVIQYQGSISKALFEIANGLKLRRIGFDENHLTHWQYKQLIKNARTGVKLVGVNSLVEKLREIKENREVAQIKKALHIHKKALIYLRKYIKPNSTEVAVYERLKAFVESQKAGFSFDPIVASGPNGAYPHAKLTSRKFRRDDVVLVDTGIDYKGYKSDLTRMFLLGKIPQLLKEVLAHVHKAQKLAIAKIRPGVMVAEVDRVARNYLEKHKLAKYFGHALGHGVGLEIHESPRLSQQSPATLKEGMVITVEPAVYIPQKFGVRIEDMVLVTKKGCEVLSGDINQ